MSKDDDDEKQTAEQELQAVTACKPKKGEGRQDYLTRLQEATQGIKDDEWEGLSQPAQQWANDAANAVKEEEDIEDFADDESEEEKDDDKEQEESVKKSTKKADKSEKDEPEKKTSKKANKPAAKAKPEKAEKKKTEKAEKKPAGRPLSEGKVEGIKFSIKEMICSDPKIGVDDLVKRLGGKMSKITVANVRADFRHSLRTLRQLGHLKGIDL